MPINSLGYPCIKKLQRDNLWHAYNMPINIIQCDSGHETTIYTGELLLFEEVFETSLKSSYFKGKNDIRKKT